ncbi:hypothetical protein LPJ61_000575 [Coemansia biformis]|uniref:Globin-sensor domain-containing protein n=1 Tax=Coemansia biformis TaxID=1286918 RepID=A0A9W7YI24_9FUNG|nr:hypothetical protein LPJ61_000575 [Coemansia biformis]
MKTVDREKLYTDLQYRFEYISGFIGFTKEDQDLIHKSGEVVAGVVPAIVDAVYDKLFNYDITWVPFAQSQEGLQVESGTSVKDVTMGSEVIAFRKTMMTKYLKKLVRSEWNASYIKYLDWVGHIHTSTPLKQSTINVEYIHCNAMLGYVSAMVVETLQTAGDWDQTTRDATVNAFNKFFWIQNDLFARYYVKDRLLTEDERTALAQEEQAKKTAMRSAIRSEFLLITALGAAAGIAIGAIAYRVFARP